MVHNYNQEQHQMSYQLVSVLTMLRQPPKLQQHYFLVMDHHSPELKRLLSTTSFNLYLHLKMMKRKRKLA
jgi:hypothetical protein